MNLTSDEKMLIMEGLVEMESFYKRIAPETEVVKKFQKLYKKMMDSMHEKAFEKYAEKENQTAITRAILNLETEVKQLKKDVQYLYQDPNWKCVSGTLDKNVLIGRDNG